MRIKTKAIATLAIAPAVALLVFLIVSVRTYQAEDRWAAAAQDNLCQRIEIMRDAQSGRNQGAR